MHPRPPLPRTRPAARAWLAALLLALVLAQALGFMHRIAHGQHGHPAAGTESHGGHHWLQDLFAGHEEGQECPLFEALKQPGGVPPVHLVLALPAACAQLAVSHGDFVARWAALFDARGPPLSR